MRIRLNWNIQDRQKNGEEDSAGEKVTAPESCKMPFQTLSFAEFPFHEAATACKGFDVLDFCALALDDGTICLSRSLSGLFLGLSRLVGVSYGHNAGPWGRVRGWLDPVMPLQAAKERGRGGMLVVG
jgi:hypothetical protein